MLDVPPPPRWAIPIGDGTAALAHLDGSIAEAERTCARERARRRGSKRSLPRVEADLARLRAQRAAILAGLKG